MDEQTKKTRLQRKPTAFERRVEARAIDQVTKALEANLEPAALTDPTAGPPEGPAAAFGPAQNPSASPFAEALQLLQKANLATDARALRLLADLAELAQGGVPALQPRASHRIQPSGGGVPMPDLRAEYERRISALRLGDIAGLMEIKRDFRKRGLEVY